MEVVLEQQPDTTARIKLSLTPEDYQKDYTKKLAEFSKKANMKGFRPGKVPQQLIEKMHGKAIKSELITDLVNQKLDEYLKDNNIRPFTRFVVESVPEDAESLLGDNAEFIYKFYPVPAVDDKLFSKMTVKRPKIELTTEEMAKEVDNIRRRHSHYHDQETSSDESVLTVSLKAGEEEPVTSYLAIANTTTDKQKQELVGLKVGDEKEIDLIAAFGEEEARRLLYLVDKEKPLPTGPAHIKVTNINEVHLADVGPDLLEKEFGKNVSTEGGNSLENLQLSIGSRFNKYGESLLEARLLDALKEVQFNLPETFIKENVLQTDANATEEDKQASMEMVKTEVLAEGLLSSKKIEVSYSDVKDAVLSELLRSSYGQFVEQLDEERQNAIISNVLGKEKESLNRYYYSAKLSRFFKELGTIVNIVDDKMSLAQYLDEVNRVNKA